MKKIDFTDLSVFEKLEDEAIDGVLNYEDFPPEEYKYFSKLAKLGYCNRNKGWDIDICLKKQEEYRTDYSEEKAYANRFVAMFKRYNDNNIKVQELETKMYKAESEDDMLCFAIKIIEKLLDENGFEERMTKKINFFRQAKGDVSKNG